MKKREIVKKNQEFKEIIKNKKRFSNNLFVIYYNENKYNKKRYGISVSKKIGNAVVRNKIKRQIKNIIDKNQNIFKNNQDYIIIVRKEILNYNYNEIEISLIDLLQYKFRR